MTRRIRTDVTYNMQIKNSTQLNAVIFKDKAAAPVGKKFVSLFPGLGYAAGYKVCGTSLASIPSCPSRKSRHS